MTIARLLVVRAVDDDQAGGDQDERQEDTSCERLAKDHSAAKARRKPASGR